jgi:RecA-family ATPase
VPPGARFDDRPYDSRPLGSRANGHAEAEVEPEPTPPADEEDDFDSIDSHILPKVRWKWARTSDWADRDLPEREWILPGWIPRLQATGIYGIGGVNKTDLCIQMLMARSRGLDFVGFQMETSPVLGMFCEDTEEEVIRRATRIARFYGMALSDFPDFHFVSLVGYDQPEFVEFEGNSMWPRRSLKSFDKRILESGAQFAVLDTAPHFFGGNEIDRRQVSRFIRKLDAISIMRRCAIVFTAHPSQSGRKSGRLESGSTAWEGSVRARLSLARPDEKDGEEEVATDERILTLRKSNYAEAGKQLRLSWKDGVFSAFIKDGDVKSEVPRSGPERTSSCIDKFLDLLEQVGMQGGHVMNVSSRPDTYAPTVFAVMDRDFSRTEYTRAMNTLWSSGRLQILTDGPPSKQRKFLVSIKI